MWWSGLFKNPQIANSFDSGQPAQSAQTDLGRHCFADAYNLDFTN